MNLIISKKKVLNYDFNQILHTIIFY